VLIIGTPKAGFIVAADRNYVGMIPSEELQWRQATARAHQQARQLLVALLASGGRSAAARTIRTGDVVHSLSDASPKSIAKVAMGRRLESAVLDCGGMAASIAAMEFGSYAGQPVPTWCEVRTRPLDWHPAPAKGV